MREAEQTLARETQNRKAAQREMPSLADTFTECEALAREIGVKER
jgi:hypothetical protein